MYNKDENIYNTIIIGGGSAGLYLATLLERNKMSYKIIEGFHQVGGQCITAYPYKYIYDIPGLGPITGDEYIKKLLHDINMNNIILNTNYISHKKVESHWMVHSTNGDYVCKNIVFATGVGMGCYQKPQVEKLSLYENKQIFFFPKSKDLYINKKIAVFGGGDSAFDALDFLNEVTDQICLIHRRPTFSATKGKQQILCKVPTYTPYTLVSLNGNEDLLQSVTIKNNQEHITLDVDYIFFCYGYNTTGNLKFSVNMNNMCDINGVFAIGAASTYSLKRDLITTGLWESRIVFEHLNK